MAAAVASCALVTMACEPAGAAAGAVQISFDDVTVASGASFWSVGNQGSAPVKATIVSKGGGSVRRTSGRSGGSDRAGRFPTFDPSSPAPVAVLMVRNSGSTDSLNPRTARFTFGADFTLDRSSADQSSWSVDDGDNLVQRGLWGDRTQYKLELDARRPTCRIKGRSGTVSVTAGLSVEADRWYRAACTRNGSTVSIAVTSWGSTGAATTRTWSASGSTGDMTPSSGATPIGVGGKLNGTSIDSDPDQFNGRIDNVRLTIG